MKTNEKYQFYSGYNRNNEIILIPIESKDELPLVRKHIPSHGIHVSYNVWTDKGMAMYFNFHINEWEEVRTINPAHFKRDAIIWYKEAYLSELDLSPVDREQKTLDGWINVKEKMPKDEVNVLLLTSSKKIDIGDWYEYDKRWRTQKSSWHKGNLISGHKTEDITHWMSLPKKP